MRSSSKDGAAQEIVVHARGYQPVAVFFLIVPTLIVAMTVFNIMTMKLPIPLIGLLVVVVACCFVWIKSALSELGDLKIEGTPQELRIAGLLGSTSYAWSFIDEIKLVNPGASMSDTGRNDEGRIGIGLFMRLPPGKTRPADAKPDAILMSGSREEAEKVMDAADRILAYQRKTSVNSRGRRGGGFNAPKKNFRKTGAAAAA